MNHQIENLAPHRLVGPSTRLQAGSAWWAESQRDGIQRGERELLPFFSPSSALREVLSGPKQNQSTTNPPGSQTASCLVPLLQLKSLLPSYDNSIGRTSVSGGHEDAMESFKHLLLLLICLIFLWVQKRKQQQSSFSAEEAEGKILRNEGGKQVPNKRTLNQKFVLVAEDAANSPNRKVGGVKMKGKKVKAMRKN